MSFFLTAKLYHDNLKIVSNISDIGFASIQSIFGYAHKPIQHEIQLLQSTCLTFALQVYTEERKKRL